MPEMNEVTVMVVSQKGTCHAGHEVGDQWTIAPKTPEGICLGAFHSLSPAAMMLVSGAPITFGDNPNVVRIACPDSENPVVFELRRLQKQIKEWYGYLIYSLLAETLLITINQECEV